jgi:thiamine biosynthesis lipoprotein
MAQTNGLPPVRRLIVPGLFVAALFAVWFFRQPPDAADTREQVVTGPTMGTIFTVKVVTTHDDEATRHRVAELVREVVDTVEAAMSTYRPDSEIEIFNHHGTESFRASPEMLEVVAEAQRVARLSSGAFDITVGPLVDLWGFGPSGLTEAPSEEKLAELVGIMGYEQIEVDPVNGTLRKAIPECRIDLSAIAKGFAVDKVAAALDGEGFSAYMVEIGGEVRTRGRKASGDDWRIGIERPDSAGRAIHTAISLTDLALATSGDYRNFVVRDGVRISHTIDPRNGRPIAHDLASVSVLHSSCMTADALATALEVLGPEEGFDLAQRQQIPALFLIRTGEMVFEERSTDIWAALVENSATSKRVG